MDELKELVIDDIRSCLISSKGGVPITQINRDYKMIVGHPIPYIKLGYSSLEDFLKSVPGLNVIIKGGECVLEALPTKNTVHITAMVRGQKSSTSRRKAVHSNFGQRPRPVKKVFSTPIRRVLLPAEVPKRVVPSPPHLTSLSRSNLPPRLKGQQNHPPVEKISVSPNLHGQRKGPDHQGYGDHERLPYQEDVSLRHSNPIPSLSPMESSNPASSVLRTPTGVLGPNSPLLEFPMPGGASGPSRLPPPLMGIGLSGMPQRTSAQSRLSRQFSSPVDKDMKMPSLTPPYDANPFFPKTLDNQFNKVHPPVLDNKNLQMSADAAKDKVGFCNRLDNYCKAKNLPKPNYKVITNFPKSNAKQLVCSIKIGNDLGSYSSYPTECKTAEEAIEVASQSALETLEKTFGKLGESLPVTADDNLIVTRVAEIVDKHPCGLWSAQLPAEYREIHNESLPEEWLDILRASCLITIDYAAHNRSILLPNRSGSAKRSSTPSSVASGGFVEESLINKFDEMAFKTGKKSPEFQHKLDDNVTTLGQLSLPEDEFWNVYVSYATSTSNIWIRLIGEDYSALYDDVAADMELFYMSEGGKLATELIVGHYYALQVDDCWHRVELTELTEEVGEDGKMRKLATCFFVDNGDDDVFEASKLRILDSSFTKLPSQAVQCRLSGLEDFSSDQSVESHLVNNIIGHNLIAKAYIGESEDDGMSRPYPSLILFDTSTDENINLNNVLLEKIIQDAVPPSLLKNGKIQEAYVSHVEQSGSLYIQLPSSIFDYMMKMIEEYSCNIVSDGENASGKIVAGVPVVHPDVMYLARYDVDKVWYRAVLDSKRQGTIDGKVWVKFVDFGNSELTSLKDLVILPSLNSLCKLPHQAIECRLHGMSYDLQFTQKGLDRCREIVPSEDPVLLKVASSTSDSAAVTNKCDIVEIFKRVQPDNLLASVSTTLTVEEGIFEKAIPESNRIAGDINDEYGLNYSTKSNERFSKSANMPSERGILSRTLCAPKVPRVGELFDVHVTIAANPGNFTVQPWKDNSIFSNMMNEMQYVYSSASKKICTLTLSPEEIEMFRQPLEKDQVIEGGVYAALHEDQLWYRITVSKLMAAPYDEEGDVMVSGYFLDFGDVAVLMLDKLRMLAPLFYKVPYQAIKAKLSGIAPVHSDWSVEDCLRFQEMVCEKQFVATVVETGPDLIDPTDTVIGIHLTDTSEPNLDISIGKTFIEEGRAVAC